MTARVLVVDDILANVKLLEAKLTAEYFDVVTAMRGADALVAAREEKPDIILLDVMMPEMDGFAVCRRLKATPETAHIPVVMVTAFDQPSDRVTGLEAGADDFLTKPVNDIALFARVRSLVRLKLMTDELRLRQETGHAMGLTDAAAEDVTCDGASARILLVEDRAPTRDIISGVLAGHDLTIEPGQGEALVLARSGDFDLVIVSMSMSGFDALRFCSQLRSLETTRATPILTIVEEGDIRRLVRALEIGVNDYLIRPVDPHELAARVRTQLRRKRYADRLRQNLQLSLEMAITDQLTGLYNRRYMTRHLNTLARHAAQTGKPVSLLILDIDFFKAVNDSWGHPVGDEVLKEFATRLARNVRGIDLACRYGGEEFVVVMPDTDVQYAYGIAERVRQQVAEAPFPVSAPVGALDITISIGVAASEGPDDTAEKLLRRADAALYRAKRDGRNRVVSEAA